MLLAARAGARAPLNEHLMSEVPSIADIERTSANCSFVPKADVSRCSIECTEGAGYSITSSARASSVGGIAKPKASSVVSVLPPRCFYLRHAYMLS